MSGSLTHNSTHTPPCILYKHFHTHTHCLHSSDLLPSAGLPQQLGCAGAGELSELARQVFLLQEHPQDPARAIYNLRALSTRREAQKCLACRSQAGGQTEIDRKPDRATSYPVRPLRLGPKKMGAQKASVGVPEQSAVQQGRNRDTSLVYTCFMWGQCAWEVRGSTQGHAGLFLPLSSKPENLPGLISHSSVRRWEEPRL